MITYVNGDIFQSGAIALVNTVNTVGVMGKGLALQFKKRFPNNFREYEKACRENKVELGKMLISCDSFMGIDKIIINFPTKNNWKSKSHLEDIISGLHDLVVQMLARNIASVAIPPLGCGLGGLHWEDVKREIEIAFSNYPDLDVQVYEPLCGANPAPVQTVEKKLTNIKAAVLVLFMRYMDLAVSTEMTFVEAHKLCYIAQSLGLDFKLDFAPYRYGPFANNLNYLLRDMESIWISGYRDGTQPAFSTFSILPKVEEAYELITPSTQNIIDKVFNFIEGYETPLGMELLATVHWIVTRQKIANDLQSVKNALHNWCDNRHGWGQRKAKYFPPPLIENAIARIKSL